MTCVESLSTSGLRIYVTTILARTLSVSKDVSGATRQSPPAPAVVRTG